MLTCIWVIDLCVVETQCASDARIYLLSDWNLTLKCDNIVVSRYIEKKVYEKFNYVLDQGEQISLIENVMVFHTACKGRTTLHSKAVCLQVSSFILFRKIEMVWSNCVSYQVARWPLFRQAGEVE